LGCERKIGAGHDGATRRTQHEPHVVALDDPTLARRGPDLDASRAARWCAPRHVHVVDGADACADTGDIRSQMTLKSQAKRVASDHSLPPERRADVAPVRFCSAGSAITHW